MKIAVTYENGKVFAHFGKATQFKIYEVKENHIQNASVVDAEGSGHEAQSEFLKKLDVSVVISGGMGAGAQNALTEAGILTCTGAKGDCDEAVEAFLAGELTTEGVNCKDKREEAFEGEKGGCGGSCGSSCGSGCGGGCSGCGPRNTLEGPNAGKTVKVHYQGTFDDGTQFDSSYDRGEPLEFVCGAGMMIKGFDKAVVDMKVGDIKNVHLMPEEAYGEADPNAIFTVPLADLPGAEELVAGDQAYLTNMMGQPFLVKVVEKTDTAITFDANHEMAGKELNFKIELVSID